MSSENEQASVEKKPIPPAARIAIAVGVVLLLLLITWWSGQRAAAQAREAAFRQGVDGLAAALTPVMLERNWVKAERLMVSIVQQAGFESVVLADPQGKVLAATDARYRGQTMKDLARAPAKASLDFPAGVIRARRQILLAEGNPIGTLMVITRR